MKNIDLICYDFDGTLCNTLPDIAHSMNVVLEKNGFSAISDVSVKSFIGSGISKLVERSVRYASAGKKTDSLEPDLLEKITQDMSDHYTRHLMDNSFLYDDTKDVLTYFSDIPQLVVSNKPEKMLKIMLEYYGIAQNFELIVGGDTLAVSKPDIKVWEHIRHKMNLKKNINGIMVGDSIPDLKFGKVAGMTTVAVSYGYNDLSVLKAEGADYVIDRLAELKNMF